MDKDQQNMGRKEFIKTSAVGLVAAAGLLSGVSKAKAAGKRRWAMVIDLRRCIGCRACTIACKKEMAKPLGTWNSAVKQVDGPGKFPKFRKYFMPILCNHCEGTDELNGAKVPPCVDICPQNDMGTAKLDGVKYTVGATYKRPDGAVLYDSSKCIGCYACVDACPYGARHPDPNVPLATPDRENPIGIGKCTFCNHRVDKGVVPSCVNTCQAKARIFGDLNDPDSPVSKVLKGVKGEVLLPKEGTRPHVFYIDPNGVVEMSKYKKELYKDQVI